MVLVGFGPPAPCISPYGPLLSVVCALVGSVYGVTLLLLVPVVGRILGPFGSETVVFGLVLILLTYLAPTGLAGIAERLGVPIRSRSGIRAADNAPGVADHRDRSRTDRHRL